MDATLVPNTPVFRCEGCGLYFHSAFDAASEQEVEDYLVYYNQAGNPVSHIPITKEPTECGPMKKVENG